MIRYIMVKLGQALLSILGASIIVFLLARGTGDPTLLMLSSTATPEEAQQLKDSLGLNDPLYVQYLIFIGNALRGDFGMSIQYKIPALEVVLPTLANTVSLAFTAFIIVAAIAIPAGVYAAYRRDSRFDKGVLGFAAAGQAFPSFWIASMLIFLFAVTLRWLPTSGIGGIQNYILPVLTLVIFAFAGLARLTRSSTLETLGTEYIRFARVKGVSERNVLWGHSFRNASLSVLTFGALVLLSMLTGSIIVETVFAWPGLGRAVVQSVNQRDFPVVQLIVLMLSVFYIVGNFIVDVLYAVLNPRIRTS